MPSTEHIFEEVHRRGVTPLHAFIAFLLAALREFGVINYGVVQEVTRKVGEKMAAVYGRTDDSHESIRRIAELLEVGEFEVQSNGSKTVFRLKSSTCRFCPKGVGGLELPGKLCPFVGLLAGFSGTKSTEARREGSYCVIEYEGLQDYQ